MDEAERRRIEARIAKLDRLANNPGAMRAEARTARLHAHALRRRLYDATTGARWEWVPLPVTPPPAAAAYAGTRTGVASTRSSERGRRLAAALFILLCVGLAGATLVCIVTHAPQHSTARVFAAQLRALMSRDREAPLVHRPRQTTTGASSTIPAEAMTVAWPAAAMTAAPANQISTPKVNAAPSAAKHIDRPATRPAPAAVRARWREVGIGLSKDRVRDLLGEPVAVATWDTTCRWGYADGASVSFSQTHETVEGWVEPQTFVNEAPATPVQPSTWRRLRPGITTAAVRALLGDPAHVTHCGSYVRWSYGSGGTLSFAGAHETVDSWIEPDTGELVDASRAPEGGSWQQLKPGMTPREVRALVGEPQHIANNGLFMRWSYPAGHRLAFRGNRPTLESTTTPSSGG